jgi:hypothetical protein
LDHETGVFVCRHPIEGLLRRDGVNECLKECRTDRDKDSALGLRHGR